MRYATRHLAGSLGRWFHRVLAGATLLAALLTLPGSAEAQGIFLTGVGPVNQAMGGAAVAAPLDSAGALAWNPATISGLKRSEAALALGVVLPTSTISSQAFGLSGSTQGEPGVTPIPTMSFVAKDDCSPWTWGVGVFGIGGFSTNFASSALFAPNANPILTPQPPTGVGVGRVFSRAEIYQVIPTISYAATEKLSFGIAPILDLASIQADPLLFAAPNVVLGIPTYGPGTGSRYAFGGGFQAGVYYITDYNWRFGASYKSKQWFEKLRFNSNDSLGNPVLDKVGFDLPQIISVGASYTGFERMLYAMDVRWTDYNSASGFNGSGFRADGSVEGLGWRNVMTVVNAIQYNLTDRLALRTAYTYVGNPVPLDQTNFNLGTSLIMQNFFSCGGTYMLRDNVAFNIAYTHGFRASISGPYVTPAGALPNTNITATNSADHVTMGLTVLF